MFVVGGIALIAFMIWELQFAAHPIQPRYILNRTFVSVPVVLPDVVFSD